MTRFLILPLILIIFAVNDAYGHICYGEGSEIFYSLTCRSDYNCCYYNSGQPYCCKKNDVTNYLWMQVFFPILIIAIIIAISCYCCSCCPFNRNNRQRGRVLEYGSPPTNVTVIQPPPPYQAHSQYPMPQPYATAPSHTVTYVG